MAKLLEAEHPGLTVIVKTSPDAASQANALEDLSTQGIDALVILPSDPDPLVNAIKEVKAKGTFVTLVDRAPSNNDTSVRDLYVAGNNPALGTTAGDYIKTHTPDAQVAVIRGLPIPIDQQRQDGFDAAIKGSNVKVLEKQFGNWNRDDAFKVMQDYLTKYPKIDVVWCQDDDMAGRRAAGHRAVEAHRHPVRDRRRRLQGHGQEGRRRRQADPGGRALSAGHGGHCRNPDRGQLL